MCFRGPRTRWPYYLLAVAGGAALAQVQRSPGYAAVPSTGLPPRSPLAAVVPVEPTTITVGVPDGIEPARDHPALNAAARVESMPRLATEIAQPVRADPLGQRFREGMVMTGSTPHRLILFTFDDGPDRVNTPLLLDRLDREEVKAVFFLTANRIAGHNALERRQQEIAREIARRGHIVANHTLDHAQLPLLDDELALAQVVGTEEIFQRVFGGRPWIIRPPYGARSARIDQLLGARGYTTMMWNLGSGDFQVKDASEVYETWRAVFANRERETGDRGGIILMHDTYPRSVDAFQMILADLRARNCELLAAGEELFDIVDDPSFFFVPRSHSQAVQEAPPARPSPQVLRARQERLRRSTERRCNSLAAL